MKKLLKYLVMLVIVIALTLALAGCAETTPAESGVDFEKAINSVMLPGDLSKVIGNIALPETSIGIDLVWSSSNEAIITTDGTVTRESKDGENQIATLTATITDGEETFTKDFRVKVLKFEVDPSTTIAQIKALETGSQVYAVEFTVLSIYQAGYYITDGVDIMNVYTGGIPTLEVGQVVTVSGDMASYRDAQQIADSVFEVVSDSSSVTGPEVGETAIAVAELDEMYSSHSSYNMIFLIEGIIVVETGDYVNYYIVDKDTGSQYQIYYKSPAASLEALDPLNGKFVKGVFYTYNSGYVMTFATEFEELVLDPTEQIKAAISGITAGFDAVKSDFVLPSTVDGYEITWTTEASSLVIGTDAEGNASFAVTRPTGSGAEDETSTITGTFDGNTITLDITIAAKNTQASIAEIIAIAIDKAVEIENVKVMDVMQSGFYFTDGVDLLFVYGGQDGLASGDIINILGERGSYKDGDQIGNPTVTKVTDFEGEIVNPAIADKVYTVNELLVGMADGTLINKQVNLIGTISIEGDYSNSYFNAVDNADIQVEVYYKSPEDSVELLKAEVGNTITTVVYVYNNESLVFTGVATDIIK